MEIGRLCFHLTSKMIDSKTLPSCYIRSKESDVVFRPGGQGIATLRFPILTLQLTSSFLVSVYPSVKQVQ